MLTNAHDDTQISALILPFKVDEAKFTFGFNLKNTAYDWEIKQIKLHGQQYRAKKKFEKLFDETNEIYQEHLRFIRLYFEDDPEKLKELGAYEKRIRDTNGWLKQSKTCYKNFTDDPEALAGFDEFGVTLEDLQNTEQKVFEVDAADKLTGIRKMKLGAAQDAVEKRDDALKELHKFMTKFKAICRIALKDHPQLLEKLGIKVYSRGYKRKKPETNEAETENQVEQPQTEEPQPAEGQTQ
jgi:hypothetical protein